MGAATRRVCRLSREQSAVSLFAGSEAPHGISEHNARTARGVLKAISYSLATVWSYRACLGFEAVVVLAPEHVKTIHRDGFSKQDVRRFLFENTGIPVRCYDDEPGEGVAQRGMYKEIRIDGEACYQKFRVPEAIKIVVAGGTAGTFSAVVGSWSAGPRAGVRWLRTRSDFGREWTLVNGNKTGGFMPITLVNPMNEIAPTAASPAPRLATMAGRTIALLDISKPGGNVFLDRIEVLPGQGTLSWKSPR